MGIEGQADSAMRWRMSKWPWINLFVSSQEVKDAQGLMMNFGDAQAETQLKRKLSHLRAEHDLVKGERDHFKRLCQNLGR